jgi:uncharacterized phage infection (PIP) family protein YhgE
VDLLSRDGQDVEFNIKRVLEVREPSRVSNPATPEGIPGGTFNASGYHSAIDLFQLRAEIDGQRDDISRIDSNGSRVVSALDTRVARVEGQLNKLKDTLGLLRRDISGVQEDISSLKSEVNSAKRNTQESSRASLVALEQGLASTNETLDEVRQEVGTLQTQLTEGLSGSKSELRQQKKTVEELRADLKGRVTARERNKDMAALRAEMAQMKRQMDEMRSKATERPTVAHFPSKELDILTSNIAKIGKRASQVETLQMEFEILKGRVERAEASRQRDTRTTHSSESGGFSSYARKRTLSGTETSSGPDPMLKRPAFSPGYSDTPTRVYDGSPEVPRGSPQPSSQAVHQEDTASVRQMRTGRKRKAKSGAR